MEKRNTQRLVLGFNNNYQIEKHSNKSRKRRARRKEENFLKELSEKHIERMNFEIDINDELIEEDMIAS